eukprot:scaffold264186_cov43-Prasinocladus_malaysianus.AAC.2
MTCKTQAHHLDAATVIHSNARGRQLGSLIVGRDVELREKGLVPEKLGVWAERPQPQLAIC